MTPEAWTYIARDTYRHPCGWEIRRTPAGWQLRTHRGVRGPFKLVDDAIEVAELMPKPADAKQARLEGNEAARQRAASARELDKHALRVLQRGDVSAFGAARHVQRKAACSWAEAVDAVDRVAQLIARKRAS